MTDATLLDGDPAAIEPTSEQGHQTGPATIAKQNALARAATAILKADDDYHGSLEDPTQTDLCHGKMRVEVVRAAGVPLDTDETCLLPDSENDDDDEEDARLHPLERRVASQRRYLRRWAKAHSYFGKMLTPCGNREKLRRVQYALNERMRDARGDAEIAVIAAAIDGDLSDLGASFDHRRGLLALVLRCARTTANTIVTRGRQLIANAIADAKRGDGEPLDMPGVDRWENDRGRLATVRATVRAKSCQGTGQLTKRERAIVAQTLVLLAVEGAFDTTEKAARKLKLRMPTRAANDALDGLGLQSDGIRCWLGSHSADEQKKICTRWTAVAISGTLEQREAMRTDCEIAERSTRIREYIRTTDEQVATLLGEAVSRRLSVACDKESA